MAPNPALLEVYNEFSIAATSSARSWYSCRNAGLSVVLHEPDIGLMNLCCLKVSVQLYIAAISDVDQKTQKVDLEGYFRLEWMDPRLANDDGCGRIILQLPTPSVWQPDIYFDNSVREWYSAGSLIVYPDGRVWRSVRFHHLLRCPMEFHALPFDKQRCFLQMSSYSWDLDNINAGAWRA